MNKKEVLQLIESIEILYDNPFTKRRNYFNQDQSNEEVIVSVVNAWHDILKDESVEMVLKNFKRHIKTNKFHPTIAELLRKEERYGPDIPRDFVYDLKAGEDWH